MMNMKFWNYGNASDSRPMSRVLAALGISILAYFHTSTIAYCGEAAAPEPPPARLAYNYCTLSYTFAYYSDAEWDAEIDRLAKAGYNAALVLDGTFKVWQSTLRELGCDEKTIAEFIPDECARAWWLMDNLYGEGGPLDQATIDADGARGRRICAKMREKGIEPILQGFFGMMPKGDLPQGKWGLYERPPMVNPTGPDFAKFAATWYRNLEKVYGFKPKYLAGDLFHEGGKAGGINVTAATRAVQGAQQAAFPGVTWVVQAWQRNPTPEVRAGLDPRFTLIEALVYDMSSLAKNDAVCNLEYGELPWIWCEVLNFGGNHGLYGNLKTFAHMGRAAKGKGAKTFRGYGSLSEGFFTNPVCYDLFEYMMMRPAGSELTDAELAAWLDNWVDDRYGLTKSNSQLSTLNSQLHQAWKILAETAYACPRRQEGTVENLICAKPSWDAVRVSAWGPRNGLYYDAAKLEKALELMEAGAGVCKTREFAFDLYDLKRQVIANRCRVLVPSLKDDANARAQFLKEAESLAALNAPAEFRLVTWEARARARAGERGAKAWRRMVKTWYDPQRGSDRVEDYAHREYQELLRDYYIPRWKKFFADSAGPVAAAESQGNSIRLYSEPLSYEVAKDGKVVVPRTEIGLLVDGVDLGSGAEVNSPVKGSAVKTTEVATPIYKKGCIDVGHEERLVDFGSDFAVRLVARPDGVAYRFELKKSGAVTDEKADLTIPKNARCWFNRTPRKMLGCEETVPQFADASALKTDERWAYYLPFVYSCGGTTVAVTESDVADYPVWNFGDVRETVAGVRLSSLFAKYPKATELSEGGARKRKIAVKGEEDFIAKASAPRPLPWRVFALADAPSKLCETDIAYALARPADGDFSWVRPGKVAWDWWNDFDNKGGAGCSTEGYVRFIDFAASNGVEYVIFDEGWSANLDIWKFSPKVDVPYLVDYANKKGVGIILWMAWAQVFGDEERVAEHFAKLGAKGFKVDFMDRGDAQVAEFLEKFAAVCAKHKMLLDYHGAYRPVGLHRKFPNILNYEGIHGLEQMKWSRKNKDMPYNDVAAFFLRMTAGPMDYTPGAMDNYPIGDYRGNGRNPGSVGTRAHQMALMALYEAPLQMLADSPTKYEKNMECFSFMAKTPVVWDATIGLGGCPESYAAAARKAKDGAWYAAAISNRDARDITIPTDFLGDGEWTAEIFRDADDADKEPTHYVHEFKRMKAGERLTFRVAPGGGFVVRFDRPYRGCANLPPFATLMKSVYAPTDDTVSPSAALALPGVILADLDGAYIGCRFRGIHIANKGGKGKGCNVRRTPDGKGLRIEFQIHDDKYIKCVLVDLTDGEGGVWARKVGTSYREASRSVKVGCHFGDVTRNDGYEVYGLFAAPSEPKPLPVIPQPAEWKPTTGECDLAAAKVAVKIDAGAGLGEDGYTMKIEPDAITVVAGGATGAVWARQTLAQLKAHGAASQCGEMRDVPKYRVRSFMMDVGRMHHSMDFMYDLARTMSYYKMNVLHVHLNDNAGGKDPNKYAAFRLESETYPELTAKDGHYTKKEFRDFMLFCKSIGVTVVPEIDVPAHSLAFTRVRPDFASKKYGADHLDLDKSEEILAWLKPLFAEYMTGDEPTFIGPYVHVGTDEYNKAEAEKFRAFQDAMFKMVMEFGYKPWAWGSLDNAKGETSVVASRDIMIDVWNNRYYHPENALKAGYTIVNIPDKIVYLVPFAGYYNDYFDCKKIYETWDPRINWRYRVPDKYLPQLAGGKFALWNDLCGKKKDGTPYTEADNWDRIHPALQTFAQKMWRGGEGNPPWEHFAALADSLSEPAGVKSTHKAKLR